MKFINLNKFNVVRKKISLGISSINSKRKIYSKKTYQFVQRKPFTSLFAVLGIFLILMIVGNLLFSPKPEAISNQLAPKTVHVYKVGSAPVVSFQGKIEKSGVIKMVAQASGIVDSINVSEGQQIDAGTNVLSLSTNYSGGNSASIARQIAQDQYNNSQSIHDEQTDILGKQRDIANKNKDNSDQLRTITAQSATDTQALFDLNKTIVDNLASQIQAKEAINPNDPAILGLKQTLSAYQSAMVQTNSSFNNLKVQSNTASGDIANLNLDIALKQLDIQEKMLNMNLEISRLTYNMALVNEANMYPSAPFAGVVNKIFVHVGDSVNSGTPIASITGNNQHVEIVVSVPENIAKNISSFEPSTLLVGSKSISMLATFVSKDGVNGALYTVVYDLDDSLATSLTDSTYIDVKIPVGVADTTNIDPFIPLDSVDQTQDEAFVYIADNKNIARVKKVTLGQIQGRYVEILSGLPKDAEIIMDRNVIEGDKVIISK